MKKILSSVLAVLLLLPAAFAQDSPGAVKFPTSVDTADSLIRASNSARTTLSGGLTSGATTVTVVSTASFPNSGAAMVDSEIFFYSGKTSTIFTGVTRGADSTTAATHVSGAAVRGVITAAHHNTLSSAVVNTQGKVGAGASMPSSGTFLRGTGAGSSAWGALSNSDLPAAPTFSGTVTAGGFAGDGSGLTNLPASPTFSGNVAVGGNLNVAGAITGNGAGITGLTGATGGVSNTGSTTIAADAEPTPDGVGKISLQTGNVERLSVEADGSVKIGGQTTSFPINVLTYGADRTGAADSTSAFTQAVTNCHTAGGCTFYVPKGRYKTSGGFTFSVNVIVRGDGMGDPDHSASYISRVDCSSPTATLFTFTAMYGKIQDITLVNTASTTPTAGAGIAVEHPTIEYNKFDFDSVGVVGYFDNVDSRSGVGWSMRNTVIHSPVRYGLRVRNLRNVDAGDWSMSQCVFSQSLYAAEAAIRVESSGGVKISDTKVNGLMPTLAYAYGIDATDVSLTTSIFQVSNSSIENVRTGGIRITGWILVNLSTIEFGIYSGTAPAIYFDGVADSSFSNIVARSNGTGVPAVLLNNCARIKQGPVHATGFNPAIAYSGTYSETGYILSNGWTSVTFQNSWANVGGLWPTTQYRLSGNTVWVKVGAQAGTAGSTMWTMPIGFRPQQLVVAPCYIDGQMRWLSFNSDGTVVHPGGGTGTVSCTISYPNN